MTPFVAHVKSQRMNSVMLYALRECCVMLDEISKVSGDVCGVLKLNSHDMYNLEYEEKK